MSRRPAWLHSWLIRHQSPVCFWLHIIGIPLTIAALVLGILQVVEGDWSLWWRPVGLLVLGYLLQWLGHLHEGNELGEVVLVKRLLRLPYRAVSPRYARRMRERPGCEPSADAI
jgi:hypothetical protein